MTKFVKFSCGEPSTVTTVTKLLHLENKRDRFTWRSSKYTAVSGIFFPISS